MVNISTNTDKRVFLEKKESKKLHFLIKAPENYSYNIEKKMSWDANKPATVYVTPELTKDGEVCKAATVILRTKAVSYTHLTLPTICSV